MTWKPAAASRMPPRVYWLVALTATLRGKLDATAAGQQQIVNLLNTTTTV